MTQVQEVTLFDKNVMELANRAARGECIVREELGISDAEMEAMYTVAYNLFQNAKYDDAAKCFCLLSMFDPLQYKYMFGIASCFHMKSEYEMASMYYVMSSALDEDQPAPFLHAAECLIAMKDNDAAKDSLRITLARAGEASHFAPIRQRAEVMLSNLNA